MGRMAAVELPSSIEAAGPLRASRCAQLRRGGLVVVDRRGGEHRLASRERGRDLVRLEEVPQHRRRCEARYPNMNPQKERRPKVENPATGWYTLHNRNCQTQLTYQH